MSKRDLDTTLDIDLGALASAAMKKMEEHLGQNRNEYSYFFDELGRIINESRSGIYTQKKTAIGLAALKAFDGSEDPVLKEISKDLSSLSFFYRRKMALLARSRMD